MCSRTGTLVEYSCKSNILYGLPFSSVFFSLFQTHSLINQVTLALNKYHILQIYTQCFLKYLYGVDI
jgi:hypothetical protein